MVPPALMASAAAAAYWRGVSVNMPPIRRLALSMRRSPGEAAYDFDMIVGDRRSLSRCRFDALSAATGAVPFHNTSRDDVDSRFMATAVGLRATSTSRYAPRPLYATSRVEGRGAGSDADAARLILAISRHRRFILLCLSLLY